MANKPNDFFVGVIEFFAVLLPGAIAVAHLLFLLPDNTLHGIIEMPTGDVAQWTAFILAAYLMGNFAFLLGAFLDPLYDRIRLRMLTPERDTAFPNADELRRMILGKHRDSMNTFQWCKAVLQLKSDEGLRAVNRFEADSKFFRSVIVVLILITVSLLIQVKLIAALFSALLILLSFWRYAERRWKSTRLAYQLVVTLFEGTQKPRGQKHRQQRRKK